MAYKQSPIGKKKCPYSPMQKKGLISDTPIMLDGNTVSSSGKRPDIEIYRPAIQSKKTPSWTDDYTSTTYSTKSGKGITKYTPKSNVKGGKTRYYDISKKNPQASMTEINREQYIDMLSRGDKATGEKYTKMGEDDVITGGDLATLRELKGK